uniref:DUF659 domain-containing protein n=1 Tax=Cajanus cajan TaxID=3821 RepID=A0A151T977_CAJCA|nr:hypothetical protein KK1_018177 [Cajanus cajan]
MDKKTKLFWPPYVAHCLDLILDIREFMVFYRHIWVLNLYMKYSKMRELARPTVTRFETSFLAPICIKQQKKCS